MTKEEIENKINELKELKRKAEQKAKLLDVFQHSYKIFLNSVYGFIGTQYSPVYNSDIAESVTLTGQTTIKEMVKFTNFCLNKIGKTDEENEWVIAGDTDSVSSDSMIYFNDKCIEISKAFDKIVKDNGKIDKLKNGTEVAIPNKNIITLSKNGKCKIKNISKHLVNKQMWNIKVPGHDTLKITEDHSIMVFRDGNIIECKPADVRKTDELIVR